MLHIHIGGLCWCFNECTILKKYFTYPYTYRVFFFYKKTCPSKYRTLAGGPPCPPPGPAMLPKHEVHTSMHTIVANL
ncbi:hypothetical protein HanIR_Chr03g0143101 [Helianthus annuus]|nr:hypothetical protein HanIR_Chr03g0143101 [Helianthus annuus]